MVLCVPFTSRAAASRFDDPLGTASNADIMTLEEDYGIMPAAAVTGYEKLVMLGSSGSYVTVTGSSYTGNIRYSTITFPVDVSARHYRILYNFTSTVPLSSLILGGIVDGAWLSASVPLSCITRSGNNYTLDIYLCSSSFEFVELDFVFADASNKTFGFGSLDCTNDYVSSNNYAHCDGIIMNTGRKYAVEYMNFYNMVNGALDGYGYIYNNAFSVTARNQSVTNMYWKIRPYAGTYMGGSQYIGYFGVDGINGISNVRLWDGKNYHPVDSWSVQDGVITVAFTPLYDVSVDDMYYAIDYSSRSALWRIRCINITSSYVPPGDTDSFQQNVSNNTTIIKNITTTISNTVSNISNTVTTISNNIVKKADEIKSTVTSGLNNLGSSVNNKLQDVKQGVTDKLQDVKTGISNKVDSMSKAVTDKLEDTKKGILDGLKELFIPSENYFSDLVTDLTSYFNDRLGFFSLPIDILLRVGDLVAQAGNADATIPFPEVEWEGQTLISAQNVGVDVLSNSAFKDLQSKIYFVGNVIMIGSLLLLVHRKFEEVLSG